MGSSCTLPGACSEHDYGFERSPRDRAADADDGGALGDRRLEVVAHAHRQLGELRRRDAVFDERIAKRPQAREHGPRRHWIVVERRQGHQPHQPGGLQRRRLTHDGPRFLWRGAELGGLAGEIDLDQDLRLPPAFGRPLVEAAQQVERIDGVDGVERPAGLAGLVRLQVANQVPAEIGVLHGQRLDLGQRFLDPVLAEVAVAGIDGGADGVHAERLRDGDEPDRVRGPAVRLGSAGDALPHRREVGGDVRRVGCLRHVGSGVTLDAGSLRQLESGTPSPARRTDRSARISGSSRTTRAPPAPGWC